jgi:hypothetical protein
MKRKMQRHSNEMIQSAITKFEAGAKLATIAKELNVNKSTIKYWLDNSAKFLPGSTDKNPIISRIGQRLSRESWDIVFASLKTLKGKLQEMSGRDLVLTISELLDLQSRFGTLSGRNSVPEKVIEKSEEVRITVQKYLQKKISDNESELSLSNKPIKYIEVEDSAKTTKDNELQKHGKNNAI